MPALSYESRAVFQPNHFGSHPFQCLQRSLTNCGVAAEEVFQRAACVTLFAVPAAVTVLALVGGLDGQPQPLWKALLPTPWARMSPIQAPRKLPPSTDVLGPDKLFAYRPWPIWPSRKPPLPECPQTGPTPQRRCCTPHTCPPGGQTGTSQPGPARMAGDRQDCPQICRCSWTSGTVQSPLLWHTLYHARK